MMNFSLLFKSDHREDRVTSLAGCANGNRRDGNIKSHSAVRVLFCNLWRAEFLLHT